MSTRVLMIGFDGMEPAVVRAETRAGRLPNLATLIDRGRNFTARNLPGFGQGVFWPCMYTGVNPGVHGRFFRLAYDPQTYATQRFQEDRDVRSPPFWQRLDERGLRTATIDILECPVARLRHGVQVADWLTHDATGQPRSAPDAELIKSLQSHYGIDRIPAGSDHFMEHGGTTGQLSRMLSDRIKAKTRYVEDLMAAQRWDLVFATFSEPHDIGHMAWHEYEAAQLSGLPSDAVRDVYTQLDDALGQLLRTTDENTIVCVLAGAGMRPHVYANPLLTPVLRILDLGPEAALGCKDPAGHVLRWQRPAPPPPVGRWRRRFRRLFGQRKTNPLRAARRFFPVPHNDNAGAVRFNVIGRDPRGKVQAGRELEALISEVSESLLEIENVTTGQPLVDEIVRVDDFVKGPARDLFPDLLVSWNLSGTPRAVRSPRIGSIEWEETSFRTGDHSRDALFIIAGHGIIGGAEASPLTPMDVGATVEGLFGPLPPFVEGRALLPALSDLSA